MPKSSTCAIDGCNKAHEARGWCGMHYRRWRITGSTQNPCAGCDREVIGVTKYCSPECVPRCSISGCAKPRRKLDLCVKHDARKRKYGSTDDSVVRWTVPDRGVPGPRGDCKLCSNPIGEDSAHRQYCGNTCAAAGWRWRGEGDRPKVRECTQCGTEIDLVARHASGRLIKGDRRMCQDCAARPSLLTLRRSIIARGDRVCHLCNQLVDIKLKHPHPMSQSADHVIPRSLGGPDVLENLALAHLTCNIRRKNKPLLNL